MKRNITLDYYRIMLSIAVIFAHFFFTMIAYNPEYIQYISDWEYDVMWVIAELAKIVVPSFFMITGFYLDFTDKANIYKYAIRITKVYIVWALFYLPWCGFFSNGLILAIYLFMGFYQLWYLPALAEAILLLYLLQKVIKKDQILLCIAVSLYIGGYLLQTHFSNRENILIYLYRNSIFYGLPFLIIGNVIRRKLSYFKYKLTVYHAITGLLITAIEGYMYLEDILNFDLFISSLFVAPVIFIYLLQTGKVQETKNKDIPHVAAGIYYIHPAVLMISTKVLPLETNIVFYQFPFVVIVSLFMTFLIIHVNKTVKIFL
ncbi:MAG: acyltransferase family protein [Flavobacteriaceae bacterium]|jgi:surface polysaccharide O-acyltransferase-like enzyme|nr:acyltransferase family protein [Flavobacteriaceae bacterium]